MEKMAVIKLSVSEIEFTLIDYTKTGFFTTDQKIVEKIKLGQDMERDGYIKPLRIAETLNILKIYRQIIDANNIDNVICLADLDISKARNQIAFFDEIYKTVSLYFRVLSEEEQISALHSAIIHSLAIPKGIIVFIDKNVTEIIQYNRRVIQNYSILNVGSFMLAEKFLDVAKAEEKLAKMCQIAQEEINKIDWLKNLEEDYEFVGIGDVFENVGKLARKSTRYPLDKGHNYNLSNKNFTQIFNLIKTLDVNNSKKLKGLGDMRIDVFAGGIAIIKSCFSSFVSESLHISTFGFAFGLVAKTLFAATTEKPLLDILGYSLNVINEFYPSSKNVEAVYNLAVILYRELKVIHKMGRGYVKILRIAASMSSSGKRISFENFEKNAFPVICNSDIFGATHKEIVIAAFVAACQNVDDFNLNEWVRYKDILEDEDPEGVKKLAMIVKLANLLNVTGSNYVKDIYCDVLGDTVILKTEVEKDASMEISQGMSLDLDFKKVFKKNLQIL